LELALNQAAGQRQAEPVHGAIRVRPELDLQVADPMALLEAARRVAAVEVGGVAAVALLRPGTGAVTAHWVRDAGAVRADLVDAAAVTVLRRIRDL
jgi:hypothetical protein